MDRDLRARYARVLADELVCAMGCTEPIAIAYCAALARRALGREPERVRVVASPNVIKNVKSVVVPNTGGQRGIAAAAAAGIVAGDADLRLEALSRVSAAQVEAMGAYLSTHAVEVAPSESGRAFEVEVTVGAGVHEASCLIAGHHTNVVRLARDGEVLESAPFEEAPSEAAPDRPELSVASIVEYADEADLDDVRDVLLRQVECNMAIAREGIEGGWGACVGRTLLEAYGDSTHNRAKALAAAGSDARMGGCELPVVINSGSGNQGLATSVPVVVYARDLGASEELMLRALIVSNLCTIHLKTGIGRLSAYCGATSAGAGAAAGVAYLMGGRCREVSHVLVNALAIDSGMICDGAKASCAAKIASAVEAGLLGLQMQLRDREFRGGDGIVEKGVENTIRNVSQVAREGMRETDRTIIDLMCRC